MRFVIPTTVVPLYHTQHSESRDKDDNDMQDDEEAVRNQQISYYNHKFNSTTEQIAYGLQLKIAIEMPSPIKVP